MVCIGGSEMTYSLDGSDVALFTLQIVRPSLQRHLVPDNYPQIKSSRFRFWLRFRIAMRVYLKPCTNMEAVGQTAGTERQNHTKLTFGLRISS